MNPVAGLHKETGKRSVGPSMVEIKFGNAIATVEGLYLDQLTELKRKVAYRTQPLPPSGVQALIKEFMSDRDSLGSTFDLRMFLSHPGYRAKLDNFGWVGSLTPKMFLAVQRKKSLWDGWTSMIRGSGTFGSGLVDHVRRALTLHMGLPDPVIVDQRIRPTDAYPVRLPAPIPLYDFQQEAVDAWFAAGGRGVIDLPPRSGKTRIMIAIVQRLGQPAIIIVPKVSLVGQTVAAFRALGFTDQQVLGVTGGKPTAKLKRRMNGALVWIVTPPTAAGSKKKGVHQGIHGLASRRVLLIDEFHHGAAKTWQTISQRAHGAYYRLGCTGTHYRADGSDLAMHSILSRAVYSRSVPEMVRLGRLVPARVCLVRLGKPLLLGSGDRVYRSGVTQHEDRNAIIVQAARELMARGRKVLVLTKEVGHAQDLAARLGAGCLQVDGGDNSQVSPALEALARGTISCVVGTSVIGEGVDVPAADALVYAAGGKSKVKIVQDYFRVLTQSEGKTHGIIVDFADEHHPSLLESAAQRLRLYRQCFRADVVDRRDLVTWLGSAV